MRPTAPVSCSPRSPTAGTPRSSSRGRYARRWTAGSPSTTFTVDETADTATCPNGLTARITRTRTAVFGARCRACPLRARCTTSAAGRTLRLHPHQALQRAHRARARDPEFQAVYRQHRPMVERSISWLVAGGNRRLRFVGTRLNDLWLHHRVAALNLRRLLTLGLIRSGGTWTLAPA